MVKEKFFKTSFFASIICIVFIYTGIVKIKNRFPYISVFSKNDINYLEGKLVSTPVKSSNGKTYSASIQVNMCGIIDEKEYSISNAKGRITILIPSDIVEAFYPGKLYSTAVKKGAFLWESGGMYYVKGKILNDAFFVNECVYGFFPKNLGGKISYLRALCRLQFKRLMYSWGNGGGLLLALLSGSREYTEKSVSDAFKNAGLSHILALSGMHLSMFSGIAIFVGKKIKKRNLSFILRISTITLFIWFAGVSPSLLRAYICNCIIMMAQIVNVRKPDMLSVLSTSFLIQTIIQPESLFNAGFILSYSALVGILIFTEFFDNLYVRFLPSILSSSLATSSAAQTFTAPISLKIFGSFCPIGIIASSVVSPFITVFIYSGLVLIILSLLFPFISNASGFFINLQYNIIKYFVECFCKCPNIHLNI